MARRNFYGKDARRRFLLGVTELKNLIGVTNGPDGGDVVIGRRYGAPLFTHDGKTVSDASEVAEVDDDTLGSKEGLMTVKEAADTLTKTAGNGRTAGVLITHAVMEGADTALDNEKLKGQRVRRGIESAAADALEALVPLSEEIELGSPRVQEVATVAANSDEEVGKLVAEIFNEIGPEGVVTVEPGQSLELEKEIVKGFTIDRGWMSPYFMNDVEEQNALYDNPVFIITSKKLHVPSDIYPLIEGCVKQGHGNIVVIADEITGDALNMLVINKLKKAANIVAVKPPSFGDRRLEHLEDIATIVGGRVIQEAEKIEDLVSRQINPQNRQNEVVKIADGVIGSARKIVVNKEDTTIFGGKGAEEDILARAESLRDRAKTEKEEWDKNQLLKRAARLEGKSAIIRVGGATETEIDQRKFRVDDSVASTKAALIDGIVAGGAVTFVKVSQAIKVGDAENDPIEAGRKIFKDALALPFIGLMENGGHDSAAKLEELLKAPAGHGFDLNSPEPELVDMKERGVIDPTRVIREVIRTAASLGGAFATMGALSAEIPEKVDPAANAAQMPY